MPFTGTYSTNLNSSVTSARSLATAVGSYNVSFNETFDSATTVYSSASNVAGSKVLDLNGGLLDAIGDPMIMTTVDFIRIKNASTTSALRVLGGTSAVPVLSSGAAFINIAPQHSMDFRTITGGLAVVAGVSDKINFEGTTRFEVVVIGRA